MAAMAPAMAVVGLKVANSFGTIVSKNKTCVFSTDQLCSTWKNHVLHNADCSTYWTWAVEEMVDVKNNDGTYKPDAFQNIYNTFFNMMPPINAPLLLAIVSSTTCIVLRKNSEHHPSILLHPLPESIACCQTLKLLLWKRTQQWQSQDSLQLLIPQGTHPGLCVPWQMWFWHGHPQRSQEFFPGPLWCQPAKEKHQWS